MEDDEFEDFIDSGKHEALHENKQQDNLSFP